MLEVQQGFSLGVGVLMVVQKPGNGLIPVTVRVGILGQGPGVFADQVVPPVPALGRLASRYWSYSASKPWRAAARPVPSTAVVA